MSKQYLNPCDFGSRIIECVVAQYLWRIITPILLTVGTVGCFLSLAVLWRKKISGTTTSVYLRCLVAGDLLSLYLVIPQHVLDLWPYLDEITLHDGTCGIYMLIKYAIGPLFIYIMCAMTVDRTLMVKYTLWHRRHCSQKTSICVIAAIVVVMFIINFHYLVDMRRVEHNQFQNDTNVTIVYVVRCRSSIDSLSEYQTYIWQRIMVICYFILPVCCIVVCNVLICRVLYKRSSIIVNSASQQRVKEARSVTIMLVSACMYFIISLIPVSIHLALRLVAFDPTVPKGMAQRRLSMAITGLIYYSNNSINCIFYCASGSLFRQELKLMMVDMRDYIVKRTCRKAVLDQQYVP